MTHQFTVEPARATMATGPLAGQTLDLGMGFMAFCECGWSSPQQRYRDQAAEEGFEHQDNCRERSRK